VGGSDITVMDVGMIVNGIQYIWYKSMLNLCSKNC